MLSISLGPLALPTGPLVLALALTGAGALAAFLSRRVVAADAATATARADRASAAVWGAGLAALVAARLAHLALNAPTYAGTPWAVLDLRDGGWHAGAGVAGGVAWLAWRAWRGDPALRRPLATAAAIGLIAWGAVGWGLGRLQDDAGARLAAIEVRHAVDGRLLTLDAAREGRPAVVNLWASWCGPCRVEMPVLADAARREPRVAFLFVNQGEGAAAVQAYLARERLALAEVWLDPRSAAGPAVGSSGLPTTVFVGADGRIVDAHIGILNAAALQARLARLR
jgi:thiol-disulfide isomerase/thioredoxin